MLVLNSNKSRRQNYNTEPDSNKMILTVFLILFTVSRCTVEETSDGSGLFTVVDDTAITSSLFYFDTPSSVAIIDSSNIIGPTPESTPLYNVLPSTTTTLYNISSSLLLGVTTELDSSSSLLTQSIQLSYLDEIMETILDDVSIPTSNVDFVAEPMTISLTRSSSLVPIITDNEGVVLTTSFMDVLLSSQFITVSPSLPYMTTDYELMETTILDISLPTSAIMDMELSSSVLLNSVFITPTTVTDITDTDITEELVSSFPSASEQFVITTVFTPSLALFSSSISTIEMIPQVSSMDAMTSNSIDSFGSEFIVDMTSSLSELFASMVMSTAIQPTSTSQFASIAASTDDILMLLSSQSASSGLFITTISLFGDQVSFTSDVISVKITSTMVLLPTMSSLPSSMLGTDISSSIAEFISSTFIPTFTSPVLSELQEITSTVDDMITSTPLSSLNSALLSIIINETQVFVTSPSVGIITSSNFIESKMLSSSFTTISEFITTSQLLSTIGSSDFESAFTPSTISAVITSSISSRFSESETLNFSNPTTAEFSQLLSTATSLGFGTTFPSPSVSSSLAIASEVLNSSTLITSLIANISSFIQSEVSTVMITSSLSSLATSDFSSPITTTTSNVFVVTTISSPIVNSSSSSIIVSINTITSIIASSSNVFTTSSSISPLVVSPSTSITNIVSANTMNPSPSMSSTIPPSTTVSFASSSRTTQPLILTLSSTGLVPSQTMNSSSTTLSVSISIDQLRTASVRLVVRITLTEHTNLQDETYRKDLETAITDTYVIALRNIGASRKRQTANTATMITTVGDRNSATGDVPVDFYITAGGDPVEASLVVAVMTRNQPEQIGGYEVISIMEIGVATATEAPPLLTNSVIITISIAGGVLLIVTACIALGVIVGIKWKRNVYRNDIETISVDVRALNYDTKESIAIQHGTPTIDKLTRRARKRSDPKRSSTLALLASSSSGQTDAWQNANLGTEPPSDETSAALFQRVSHFSEFQPAAPSPRSFKLKFHSSSVAPSPSISNQSKASVISDSAVKIASVEKKETNDCITTVSTSPKTKLRERVKLHSRRVASRSKERESQRDPAIVISNRKAEGDSEGDGGLGDVEQSSHSDGGEEKKSPPHTSRPSTKRRNARRKLNSRGNSGSLHVTTDGYDTTTDHKSHVPPSRQSRKYRSSRSVRSRRPSPVHNHFNTSGSSLARTVEHDARRELAWMSTGNGVQLISIQPMDRVPPSPQVRPSWQALPQLPSMAPNQPYSQDQLEQLLQIHKELERVEQGLQQSQHQRGGYIESNDSLTKSKELNHQSQRQQQQQHPVPPLPVESSSSSISAELASQAFRKAHHHPPPSQATAEQMLTTETQLQDIDNQQHQQHWFTPHHYGPQMGQLLWTPSEQAPIQTQPLSLYQLSQLRNSSSHMINQPLYSPPPVSAMMRTTGSHPFGAS